MKLTSNESPEAKNMVSQAATEEEQAKLMISHLNKELKEKQPLAIKAEKENKGLLNEVEAARKAVRDLQTKLSKIDWDPSREAELLRRKAVEQDETTRLTEVHIFIASIFFHQFHQY